MSSPQKRSREAAYSTNHWTVPTQATKDQLLKHSDLCQAAEAISAGEVVAFPTETVYGLGCDCTNDIAIQRVYSAKGRPADNPLIAHVCSEAQVATLADPIPEVARTLMAAFWPGPLTLVLPAREGCVSSLCTAGLKTIAVRMPNHPVALALIEAARCAVAAPSANTSGRPSPTRAAHVAEDLNGKILGIVDAGATGVGLESTVVDCCSEEGTVTVLRPGGVTHQMLQQALHDTHPDVNVHSPSPIKTENQADVPRAPGMKYTHYAPEAALYIVKGDLGRLCELAAERRGQGERVGIICVEEDQTELKDAAEMVIGCGSKADLSTVASRLFAVLREFDGLSVEERVSCILCQDLPSFGEAGGICDAIANRLNKAAGGKVLV